MKKDRKNKDQENKKAETELKLEELSEDMLNSVNGGAGVPRVPVHSFDEEIRTNI